MSDMPLADVPLVDLLTYLTPSSIRRADRDLMGADADYGVMNIRIGGLLYWVIYWYGSTDERTHAKYVAKDSFKAVLGAGPEEFDVAAYGTKIGVSDDLE